MNSRRNFLKNVALTAGAATLVPLQQSTAGILDSTTWGNEGLEDLKSVTVSGKVTAQGKGIANVVVSDGYSVVKTDVGGRYTFQSAFQSSFVFISLPSGYVIERQANGSAALYQKINKKKNTSTYHFELQLAKESDHAHHFIVWADPQIQREEEADLLLSETVPDTIETIKSLKSPHVFGVGCGDLIWDQHQLSSKYNQAVQQTNIPFFQVFGNHDADLEQRSDEKSTATFSEMYGPQYYSFNRGLVHYVVLNDVFFIGKDKEYIGYVTENQLAWLEKDLQFVPKGSTVVVFQHIPSFTRHFERHPEEKSLGAMVSNRKYLYKLLEPYRAHLMSGHTHFNENVILSENLYEHCHGTVCGAWWSGPICQDGTPSGYGVYHVKGHDISWHYKGTGLSKDIQFRVYKKGEHPDYPTNWSVNIWNWDEQWKAVWLEDGVEKGALVRVRAKDPLSIQLHEGPKLPVKRKWVEPDLTDHLFLFNPSEQAKEITVLVTDRFGNSYTEVIT